MDSSTSAERLRFCRSASAFRSEAARPSGSRSDRVTVSVTRSTRWLRAGSSRR
jgi:hypothetical protein